MPQQLDYRMLVVFTFNNHSFRMLPHSQLPHFNVALGNHANLRFRECSRLPFILFNPLDCDRVFRVAVASLQSAAKLCTQS